VTNGRPASVSSRAVRSRGTGEPGVSSNCGCSCFFCAAGTKKVTVPSPATELKAQPSVAGSLQKVALVAEQDMLALRSMTSSPVPVPTLESTRVSPVAAVPWIIL
jgi:hypothetical protein